MTATRLTLLAGGLAVLVLVTGTAAALPSQAAQHAQAAQPGSDDRHPDESRAAADDHPNDDANSSAGATVSANDTDSAAPVESDDEPGQHGVRVRATPATREADADRGPPGTMPAQVPDHVTRIHETIRSFLAGGLNGSLGQAIAGFMPTEHGPDRGQSGQSSPVETAH